MIFILVYFRAIPINTELKAFDNPVDVYILDPNRYIMRRWLSRQVYNYINSSTYLHFLIYLFFTYSPTLDV